MNPKALLHTPALLVALAGTPGALAGCPFDADLSLPALDGTEGAAVDWPSDRCRSLGAVGDINGDGIQDFALGDTRQHSNGGDSAGVTYVVFGGAGIGDGGTIDANALDGTNGFVVNGIGDYAYSGEAVSSAGDINGDGFDDLIIGASAYATYTQPQYDSGWCYVVFGGPGIGAGGVLNASSLDGTNGFFIKGVDSGDKCGYSVSGGGDVNGDGIDDVLIGAMIADPAGDGHSGGAYLVFGAVGIGATGSLELSSLDGTNGIAFDGSGSGGFGYSVAIAGDVSGDGVDDVIIGAHRASPNGMGSGASYLIYGGPLLGAAPVVDATAIDGTSGLVFNGSVFGDWSGLSVGGAGDVNDDGIGDLLIGTPAVQSSGASSGRLHVVFGAAPSVVPVGPVELATLGAPNGYVIDGANVGIQYGRSVGCAGDVNADGIPDILIGGGGGVAGDPPAFVVFGGAGVGASGTVDLALLDGTDGFAMSNGQGNNVLSDQVIGAGDCNGDGVDDVLVGTLSTGVHLVFGKGPLAGDINGDGAVDTADLGILIGEFGLVGSPADLNTDGIVDTADLGILISAFGSSCD